MSEEADVDTGLRIMEDEQGNGEKESLGKSSPLGKQTKVMMTGEEAEKRYTPYREIGKEGLGLSVVHHSEVFNHYSVVRVVSEIR